MVLSNITITMFLEANKVSFNPLDHFPIIYRHKDLLTILTLKQIKLFL